MAIKKFSKLILNKASHLYYNRWTNTGGQWAPGTTTCDIVEILADTIAIEQGDPSEETIDWEFGDTPLMKTYTKGERTIAAQCINLDFEFLHDVFGWTVHSTTGSTPSQMMVAETSSEEDYASIVVMFHGANAPIIVMPKVAMSSKTTIGTLKTQTATADLAGTALTGYVSYTDGQNIASDTSEFFILKPMTDGDITVAENSSLTPVSIGTLSQTSGGDWEFDQGSTPTPIPSTITPAPSTNNGSVFQTSTSTVIVIPVS